MKNKSLQKKVKEFTAFFKKEIVEMYTREPQSIQTVGKKGGKAKGIR